MNQTGSGGISLLREGSTGRFIETLFTLSHYLQLVKAVYNFCR